VHGFQLPSHLLANTGIRQSDEAEAFEWRATEAAGNTRWWCAAVYSLVLMHRELYSTDCLYLRVTYSFDAAFWSCLQARSKQCGIYL